MDISFGTESTVKIMSVLRQTLWMVDHSDEGSEKAELYKNRILDREKHNDIS